MTKLEFSLAAMTDKGLRRARNEDCVRLMKEFGVGVLADGMGGHQAGDIASQLAVETICTEFSNRFEDHGPDYHLREEDLGAAVNIANTAIHSDSLAVPEHHGMGSTVVIIALNDGEMRCAHVGDSRLYHIREHNIRRVTTDHTLAQHYVEMGVMSEVEAASWHGRNMLMRGLGIEEQTVPDISEIALQVGDILVACSDGLTDVLTDPEILNIATTPATVESTANKLIAAANRGGGPDNISVIVVVVNDGG